MKIFLQPDVLETLALCAVWFAAGVAAAVAVIKPDLLSQRRRDAE